MGQQKSALAGNSVFERISFANQKGFLKKNNLCFPSLFSSVAGDIGKVFQLALSDFYAIRSTLAPRTLPFLSSSRA
jgi:hypothetical protein